MCVSLPLCIRLTDSFNCNLLILKIGLTFYIYMLCFAISELLPRVYSEYTKHVLTLRNHPRLTVQAWDQQRGKL